MWIKGTDWMGAKLTIPSYRDPAWMLAIIAGPIFWLFYSQVVKPAQPEIDVGYFLSLALAVLIYPVLEEIVFRGWVQTELIARDFFQRKYCSVSLANAVTSVLFSLFHLINHDVLWAMLVFFPSILFGYLRDRYQAITPSILLHVYYNGGLSIAVVL